MTDSVPQDGYAGQFEPSDDTSDFNKTHFLVSQLLGTIRTLTIVKVVAVSNTGGVSPVGTVDVLPLVNMLDGEGKASKHETIHKLPYFRLQGGKNAIIMDPKVDDLGIALFADRDISSVVSTKAQANPGSRRRFDMADGLYIGGFLNVVPEQWVRFTDDSIFIQDKNANKVEMTPSGLKIMDKFGHFIDMKSTGIDINGNVTTTGTLQNNGVNVGSTHAHGGVTTGSGNTAIPH